MTQQRTMDFFADAPIAAGPTTAPPVEKGRLSRQCAEILALLFQNRRVSNKTLAGISLKYTGRISDLRKAGYDVQCVERDRTSGLSWYEVRP